MFLSAEVRWFWREHCPRQLHDWFFTAGLPPGGGRPRVDRYLPQPTEAEIGIKERGETPGLEFKGLVARRESPELGAIASRLEIWCKWSCAMPGLTLPDAAAVTKTRWLRKFDTSKSLRAEIPLDANEQPKAGYALPVQGCNVELSEVKISGRADVWWTLGFEAFGELDSVVINLTRVIVPDSAILAGMVSSGSLSSYPAWLSARLAD